ncbi:hypothetical protein ACFZB9_23685 [Kitasatospora sp. NPDC008050]|uniref:Rv1733c family protein n=1 Tax=Kitasatospora sp. NPDC008050 TaxID=3364021 RepID=UPI0036EF84C5
MSAASVSHRSAVGHVPVSCHLRRAVGREHNPLCRPVDRARSRLLIALVAAVALSLAVGMVVFLVLLGGARAHARQSALHRHEVTATTLVASTASPTGSPWAAQAQAGWAYPGGDAHTGVIGVPGDTPAGSHLLLWVGDNGIPSTPPEPYGELAAAAALYGLGALAVVDGAAWIGYGIRQKTLERRGEAAWEADWERVEPQWTGRSH